MPVENLKKARKNKKYTQLMLAEKIGVSRSCISMWETGESQPDNQTLMKLADALCVTTDYLLGRKEHTVVINAPSGYEALSEEGKKQIDALIAMLAQKRQ